MHSLYNINTTQSRINLGAWLAAALLTMGGWAASAAVINVPADQPTIVDALNVANPGDEILIQAGTYNETDAVFVWAPMTLTATNGPVIIHCPPDKQAVAEVASGVSDVVFNGIVFERPTANNDWMRTFQMNNTAAATFNNCSFAGSANGVGVILFYGGSATFNNCSFSNFNASASWASAILLEGHDALSPFSNLIVSNCTFNTGCNGWIRTAPFGNDARVGQVSVYNTTFKAANGGQAIQFKDNGSFTMPYSPTNSIFFQDCSFEGTTVEVAEFHYTGASAPTNLTFSRCVFKAYNSGRKMFWLDLPTVINFENCLFAGGQHETIMTVWGGPTGVNFNHCTMINDGLSPQSSFINGYDYGRTFNIVNSLFRCPTNFTAGFVCDPGSSASRNYAVSHSVIDHPTPTGAFAQITAGPGYSNTSLTSAFVNEASRDYHLLNGSPWVGGGTNLGYTLDLDKNSRNQGGAPDMGAYESSFTSAITPTVSIARSGGNVVVTYNGVLQSAAQLPGPFADVSGATSPWSVPATNAFLFFRTRSP